MISENLVVHLLPDDKFTDLAVRDFSRAAPKHNRFIHVSREQPGLKHIRSSLVRVVSAMEAPSYFNRPQVSSVVFHGMQDADLVTLARPEKKVFWIGMGYDYYQNLIIRGSRQKLFESETRKLWSSLPSNSHFKVMARTKIADTERAVRGYLQLPRPPYKRIDFFSPVLRSEYDAVRARNSWFKAQYIEWNYGTAEDDYGLSNSRDFSPGGNILLGNSATPENNHIEAMRLISSVTSIEKVIVPLSYGYPEYREAVISCGTKLLGSRFIPITDFLPREEYLNLVRQCSTVVMNHVRQQALGNILTQLAFGARIFLNPSSPLLDDLRQFGFLVLPFDREHFNAFALVGLDAHQRKQNGDRLAAFWGRERNLSLTHRFMERALI